MHVKALAGGILWALLAAAASPAAAKDAAPLTALDYIEIQQLVNRYAFAIDNCTNNGYDYADLYTPDGVFYWGVGSRKSVGREELAEAAGGGKNGCKKLERATVENPGRHAHDRQPDHRTVTGGRDRQVVPHVSGRHGHALRSRRTPATSAGTRTST